MLKPATMLFLVILLCTPLLATPPPISGCPPGLTIIGNPCKVFYWDFSRCFQTEDTLLYRIVQGPGQLDTVTGLWLWNTVTTSDIGNHVVAVAARVANDSSGHEVIPVVLVNVTPSSPPDISDGCSTDVLLTNTSITAQMATATSCDDNVWSLTQYKGPLTGATCTIDNTGMIDFVATDPGLYEYRVNVTNGSVADSCVHAFIVHGGSGCCAGARGNVDGVAGVDLSDLSRMISYMYNANTILGCWDEANVNGSGIIDLTDLSILISYLTVPGSVTLANCP